MAYTVRRTGTGCLVTAILAAVAIIAWCALGNPRCAWADDGTAVDDAGATHPALTTGTTPQALKAAKGSSSVSNGVYFITSADNSDRLDVANGSWEKNATVQTYAPNKSFAQRFRIRAAGGGYYRISMAASGTVLRAKRADGDKGASSSVRMGRYKRNAAAQLWKPVRGKRGIALENKATGGVLTATGTTVRTERNKGLASQEWLLKKTTFKRTTLSALRETVRNVAGGGKRAIKLDSKDTGYTMSSKRSAKLKEALRQAWSRGEDVSFVMVDLKTGITLSVGADRPNHGASTFKGAYVTYIFQKLLERNKVSYGSVQGLVSQTVGQSSNDAYLALRGRFGSAGFRPWLKSVGLAHLANEPYPRLTARELALAWTKIYTYQRSGGKYVKQWRHTFDHSYYSVIREQLGGANRVYSKPGWYPKGSYSALNDAAIVKSRGGQGAYLIAMVSNTNCYGEKWIARNVIKQIDAIHREMHRKTSR